QKTRSAGHLQRSRMELHELEIGDACAGVIGQRHAVSGRDGGVGGLAEHLTGTASGQQRGRCTNRVLAALFVEVSNAANGAILDDQCGDECVIHGRDRVQTGGVLPQRSSYLTARRISRMQDAPDAVHRFERQRGLSVSPEIESDTPLDQLPHVLRTVADEHRNGVLVAQAVAGASRIPSVKTGGVVGTDGGSNATLCVARVAFGRDRLGEHQHPAERGERDGRAEARDAAADNQEVKGGHARWDARLCYPSIHVRARISTLMTPTRIDVPTPSRSYTITIGHGILDRLGRLLDEAGAPARRFVVSSPLVWKLHASKLARAGLGEPILVPDGERFKVLQTVSKIYESLIRANAERQSTLVTFGGGVVGDMAGFAAASYLRGIALVHAPTTLLAQVDASIGGKVGVNHALGKNLIGAFHQPHTVVIDPSVLGTLPRREFRAGLYEVIKYGMTSSPALFDRIGRERTAIFAKSETELIAVI